MEAASNSESNETPVTPTKSGPEVVLEEYKTLVAYSTVLSTKMSGRQVRRVLRSLLKAPFESPDRFVSPNEVNLYRAGLRIMDIKMMLVAEQLKNMETSGLEEVKAEAARLESNESGETNNG